MVRRVRHASIECWFGAALLEEGAEVVGGEAGLAQDRPEGAALEVAGVDGHRDQEAGPVGVPQGFGSYKTAWYMCHRVRAGLAKEDFRKLMGIVEIDETFVGGRAKNRHWDKRGGGGGTGGIGSGKTPIVGAVERKGKVVRRVIDSVDDHHHYRFRARRSSRDNRPLRRAIRPHQADPAGVPPNH